LGYFESGLILVFLAPIVEAPNLYMPN